MIIKSMPRKDPTFKELYEYMHKEKNRGVLTVSRNLLVEESEGDRVVESFEKNAKYLKKRKNGNYLYHEIISINRVDNLSIKEQEKILIDLANRYLEKRGENLLAYGVVHYDTSFLHIHLMISANELYSSKRFRLLKWEFNAIQKELEEYKLKKYPELGRDKIYTQDSKEKRMEKKISDKEYQLIKRGGSSKKREISEVVGAIFDRVESREELERDLRNVGFTLYKRGKTVGLEDIESKKRYRLKKLDLFEKFVEMEERFRKVASREKFREREIEPKKEINRVLEMDEKEQERAKMLKEAREKSETKERDLKKEDAKDLQKEVREIKR